MNDASIARNAIDPLAVQTPFVYNADTHVHNKRNSLSNTVRIHVENKSMSQNNLLFNGFNKLS